MAEPEFRWTQDDWETEQQSVRGRNSSRNNRLGWLIVIVLGIVTFELTAHPALAVALGCLKFGWGEYRIARWLKRTDPDRRRGRICSRFYKAWGLWRISVVATAMMFVVACAYGPHAERARQAGLGPANNAPPAEFMIASLLAIVGFLSSASMSSLAVISALRNRIKVWVGPEAGWALEESAWPPPIARRRRATKNRAKTILFSAVVTGVGVGITTLAIVIGGRKFDQHSPIPFIMMVVAFVALPFAILTLMEVLGRRVLASTPEDCWADSLLQPYSGSR
jgi:hypothetical protein